MEMRGKRKSTAMAARGPAKMKVLPMDNGEEEEEDVLMEEEEDNNGAGSEEEENGSSRPGGGALLRIDEDEGVADDEVDSDREREEESVLDFSGRNGHWGNGNAAGSSGSSLNGDEQQVQTVLCSSVVFLDC